jgi:hypothetical protein
VGRGLRGSRRNGAAGRNKDRNRLSHEFRRQRWQLIVLTTRPAVLDRYVAPFDETGFSEAFVKCRHQRRIHVHRSAAHESDHRHRRLLRVCRNRPRRRAAE